MRRIDPSTIQKILFITLSNIGDAILTTPCLDLIRRFFPKAQITCMAGPRACEVFSDHPQVDRLILYDKQARLREKIALILRLKEERFDLVIDLRHTAIPLFIQPRYSTPLLRKKGKGHAALRHLERLKSIGIEGPCAFTLPDLDGHLSKVDECLLGKGVPKGAKYVVLGPGAASPLKRWGLFKFRQLGQLLKERNRIQIVVVGPPEDRNEFKEVFPDDEGVNLTGEFSLMQLGALLKRASLFVTNDSGPMHLAVALGTPVLAIFGPTDPEIYGPFGFAQDKPFCSIHRVVRLDLPCSPCMASFCRIKTHECLEALEVDQVFKAAEEMLGHSY